MLAQTMNSPGFCSVKRHEECCNNHCLFPIRSGFKTKVRLFAFPLTCLAFLSFKDASPLKCYHIRILTKILWLCRGQHFSKKCCLRESQSNFDCFVFVFFSKLHPPKGCHGGEMTHRKTLSQFQALYRRVVL